MLIIILLNGKHRSDGQSFSQAIQKTPAAYPAGKIARFNVTIIPDIQIPIDPGHTQTRTAAGRQKKRRADDGLFHACFNAIDVGDHDHHFIENTAGQFHILKTINTKTRSRLGLGDDFLCGNHTVIEFQIHGRTDLRTPQDRSLNVLRAIKKAGPTGPT